MKIYQVGGAVRDGLLGKIPHDTDYVVTGATIEAMKNAGFKEVGRGFPVFLHPLTGEEYALARKEIKTGKKHTDFKFIFNENISLREDLERRDFTCNAIAYDTLTGQYIDYFNGRRDIKQKILRHINSTHFAEDPLRVLRLCRFTAQLDFNVAPETLELCKKMTSEGMLQHLTAERIWNELFKSMTSGRFYRFVETAQRTGALQNILPEAEAVWRTQKFLENHAETTPFEHMLNTLQKASDKSALVNFAVLLYNVCDTLIPSSVLPCDSKDENDKKNLIHTICRRLKVPNRFRNFTAMTATQCSKFKNILHLRPDTLFDLAESMTIGHICYAQDYIDVCQAVFCADSEVSPVQQNKHFKSGADKLLQACHILASIKAGEMPDYARLPKDENFKWHLKEYKIQQLCKHLSF